MDINFLFTATNQSIHRTIDPMLTLQEVAVDIWKRDLGFLKLKTSSFTCNGCTLDRKRNFLENRVENNSTIVVECESDGGKIDIEENANPLAISSSQIIPMGFTSIKYREGSYEGDIKGLIPNGRGKLILPNKNVVEGIFVNGKLEGKGKVYFSDGRVLEGNFKDEVINGSGIFTNSAGYKYEGEFLNNKKHGKGKFTWPDGKVYEGDFKDDIIYGEGTLYYPDGSKYIGHFNKKPNGKGKMISKAGKIKEGNFKDGKLVEE